MVHPATQRVVKATIVALNASLDIGMVFPPKPGADRSVGIWTNRDLHADEILAMVPRLASANTRGGNIFMRVGPFSRDAHPGMVMLDDLTIDAVEQLSRDGFEPCLVIETSPANFQAWVKLIANGAVDYGLLTQVVRRLANDYGGDERAVSPRQPGRLPGFTNRKAKHRLEDGKFPFVKLTEARPGCVASKGVELIHQVSRFDTAGAAAGAAPKPPRSAAVRSTEPTLEVTNKLQAIHLAQKNRILREVADGRRSPNAASASEVDFAVAKMALAAGIDKDDIAHWLRCTRAQKDETYPERTIHAASSWPFNLK
ncbi:DNA-primase RepB domain-containing protein [Devosia salina]|uniref:RepB family DNA primase n=1 Tax=Devosia salina TaxID=2860336 RepID=A0ABX8WCQ0_9HYPH|nr:DNA-primase RepB domain-containing protein [Devosia salina]QYO76543.1 RepB family DNA primase [Devosia salina]